MRLEGMERGRAGIRQACAGAPAHLVSIAMKKDPTAAPARPRGRPRSFDRDAALGAAMEVFWKKGYEATSIHDLTDAMGINPPSLYAAFGDKEHLYLAAVERYQQWRREQVGRTLDEEPTARAAIERLLHEYVVELTKTCHPAGCMLASASCASASADAQEALAERRSQARRRLKERIDRGVREGDVPKGTDTAELADFFTTVVTGVAMRAKDGASRRSLLASVEAAMRAWPADPRASARRAPKVARRETVG
jgi:AcrR family transcriptional regulator